MTQGYIYKLVCKDETVKDTYIGSTWDMCKRNVYHKSYCYNKINPEYNTPVYKFIREHGDWDNWYMKTIEICECRDTRHLETVEQFYIDVHGGVDFLLNYKDAIEDKEQRREKQIISNKEPKQCECGVFISRRNLAQHKKSKKHKDRMSSSFS